MSAVLNLVQPKLKNLESCKSKPKITYTLKQATFLGKTPTYCMGGPFNNFGIHIDISKARESFINFIGLTWCDRKYKIIENVLLGAGHFLVTDSDVIAHDAYLKNLYIEHPIIMYFSNLCTSPSELRLKRAYNKMVSEGFNVKYFASKKTAEKYCESLLKKLTKGK